MPEHRTWDSPESADASLDRAYDDLKARRWRVARGDGWVSAEKGYWRETGNLLFHAARIALLVAVGYGALFGWRGNVIVREGSGFSDTLTQYDAWGAGRLMTTDRLAPFSFTLDDFRVDFERGDAQRGAPRMFEADLTYRAEPGAAPERTTVQVSEPLVANGAKVFLVGHGYAPRFIVRDSRGTVVFDDTVVFLPQDGNFTSTGVIKIPDAEPALGFTGLFLPTAALTEELGPHSTFPAPDYPAVFLSAFTGDLGMDTGAPQSVYTIDTSTMEQLGLESLIPGDTWQLPDGAGSIEFVDFERWASFQVAHDPGKELALLSAVVAMLGLMVSLFVRRRRLWVRATSAGDEGTLVEVAALGRTEGVDLEPDVSHVAALLQGHQESPGGRE